MKILLFGATGKLGMEIAKVAKQQGYNLTAVVRNDHKAKQLTGIADNVLVAEITNPKALTRICNGFDIIISALGKSVSPGDLSSPSFNEIDLIANSNILEQAKMSGISKFVYISAFHSEKYLHLEYFRVHHEFAEKLKSSGLNYSIIKPPAIFSSFLEMADMAQKGFLFNIGNGDKRTNPIYEVDLATECLNSIPERNVTKEIGGKSIYTRRQLNQIIQTEVRPSKRVKHIPLSLFRYSLPVLKLVQRNLYDKLAFFLAVMQEDTIAPQVGEMKFEDYMQMKIRERRIHATASSYN